MIGKLKKGSSFGGCIRYVTGKDEAKIIASDGVLLGTNAEMTQSFELQRQLNPRIKKPVGHIALSFKPEDKPRLTDEFMAKIALEYMQMTPTHPAKVGYFRIDSFGEASRIKAPDFSLIGTIRKGVPGMILARLMSAGTRRRGKEHSLSGTPVADCRTRF